MKTIIRFIFFLLTCVSATAFMGFSTLATTRSTDGSSADVQSKIDASSDGDVVTIPSGDFTWTSGVSLSGKGIHLQGAGSGRVVARSVGVNTIGTGSKVFTLNASGLAVTNGQTLRISVTGGQRDSNGNGTGNKPWMEGAVTSYSGTTLTMNITSVNSSGTYNLWIVSSNAATTITHNDALNPLITVTEDTSQSAEISGIRILAGLDTNRRILVNYSSGGKPVLIHHMWFDCQGASIAVEFASNKGVVWDCSFVSFVAGNTSSEGLKFSSSLSSSWNSASTMGSADATGLNNVYVEACDFNALMTSFDADDNSRVVVRHCLFNQASMGGSHGADTSNYGVRHLEIYNNECVFNAVGGSPDLETLNIDKWILLRGGTGIIWSNSFTDINSTAWGNKSEIKLACWNLQRNAGPNACWGADIVGTQYPCPRQVGFGYVTGAAGNDSVTYVGDSEPLYIWGNDGTASVALSDFGGSGCTNPDTVTDYIIAGRDYFNDGTARPGYTAYTYPHPLQASSGSVPTNNIQINGAVRVSGAARIN